jgi:hypothetical protein
MDHPNGCYFEPLPASGGRRARHRGLARWAIDSTGDTVYVLMRLGVDDGYSIRFPVAKSPAIGRLQWWGYMVLSSTPIPGKQNATRETLGPGVIGGAVTARRIGPHNLANCFAGLREPAASH